MTWQRYALYQLLSTIVRPHCSTMYVDVAYCYRPSSMVCLSVAVVSPAKTAELINMPFGLRTRGPREPCVRWGPGAPWEEAILRGKERPIINYRDTTGICAKTADRDAIWVVDLDGPKESCIRWGPDPPMGRGSFGGKGRPL